MIRVRSLLLIAAVAALVGCHDSGLGSTHDLAMPADLAPVDMADPVDLSLPQRDPTDHPAALALDNAGGATIAAMEVYTVVWPGDEALGAKVEAFVRFLVQSDWWMTTLTQYGAGPGVSKGVVVMNKPAPNIMDDNEFTGLITGMITDGLIPAPNDNTMLFFIPPTTLHSTLQGAAGCDVYGGYHSETERIDGQKVVYSVDLQCLGDALTSKRAFDDLTVTISHEAAEAQSDPYPFTDPAWVTQESLLGGEVSDLCVFENVHETTHATGGLPDTTYLVTTVYSQAAAIAGNQATCQPSAGPFFNVAVSPGYIQVQRGADGTGTATAKYLPFSFGDVGPISWTLQFSPGSGIKISPSSGEANAGDTIAFTVTTSSDVQKGPYLMAVTARDAAGDKADYTAEIDVN
ncbi:MAG: hypothetical protein ABI321_11230 [Polyangia bacterium]